MQRHESLRRIVAQQAIGSQAAWLRSQQPPLSRFASWGVRLPETVGLVAFRRALAVAA